MRLFFFVRALLCLAAKQAAMLRVGFNLKESPTLGILFYCFNYYAKQVPKIRVSLPMTDSLLGSIFPPNKQLIA
ncbi:hypothetical protein DCL20_07620 [Acinetobacter schindleri]|jgi:hypothetical protein|nr:hypothetical protein ACS72_11795 [Acinetobacter sp. VT 511]PUR01148.1 hypothetical protein DCL20_07620 [Acinetobacter schindleri]